MPKENKKRVYLDHSASTPADHEVLKAMLPYFSENYGNASSLHDFGRTAFEATQNARKKISDFLNCDSDEIIFTSGATEADNLAILGTAAALRRQAGEKKLHAITSAIEHPAVLEPFRRIESEGFEIDYLPVEKNGTVNPEFFKKAVKSNTALVSIMYVNSEIGSIQPIKEIGKIIREINSNRDEQCKIYFHSDAAQALNFLNCDVKALGVDLLSMSGHKIYGPKGIGALFVKSGIPIQPVQVGGHHEKNLRSGTLNVPAIVGFGRAVEICAKNRTKNNKKILKFRNEFIKGIKLLVPEAIINTCIKKSTPSHANISFVGVEGEAVLMDLDLNGVAVSTGSACASATLKTSATLKAIGLKDEEAHGAVRFTFGKNNTESDVKFALKILPGIIARLKRMAPEL